MKQTLDILESGNRPGRHYIENELGVYNPPRIRSAKRGITSAGHWIVVKSARHWLPWIKDTKFTLDQLRRTVKRGFLKRPVNAVLLSAIDFARNEKN